MTDEMDLSLELPLAVEVDLPVDTGPVLIRVSPGICEGWGECHKFAREIYPMGADGKVDVHVLEVPVEYAALARHAASMCPVRAIQVIAAVNAVATASTTDGA